MMKAAELFVKCLEAEGVKVIFGLPGEENAHLMMALEKSPIRFILTRQEQGAAFMADVYGRLTGEAGVCLSTLGPGATNLVTGVADANMDRSPLVAITAQAGTYRQHKESHQAMDTVAMFRPLTKWSTSILNPDNTPEIVRKAFKVAIGEKPGACHLELPEDIAQSEASQTESLPREKVRHPVPDEKVIAQALELILSASRPVILAGNGVVRQRASAQLTRFAEQTGIGVLSTFMAKGVVSRQSPQSLFTVGLQAKDIVNCTLDTADLIITVGYDLVEYQPRLWNPDGKKKILHLDFSPAEVDQHYLPALEVLGHISHTLWMLGEKIPQRPSHYDFKQQAEVREQLLTDFAEYKNDDQKGALRPQKVLWDTREAMGPDDILLSDVGAHKMWIARYYPCDAPNTCLISNGFCSMGFALPGAIAAKLVHPDRRVLAICGDGGFLMNVQEMETAKRIGAGIVVMVWEDKAYGLIEWKQKNEFGHSTDLAFENPNFVQLAQAFGWTGIRVENSADLKGAFQKAFSTNGPVLISLPIDYRENAKLSEKLGKLACPI